MNAKIIWLKQEQILHNAQLVSAIMTNITIARFVIMNIAQAVVTGLLLKQKIIADIVDAILSQYAKNAGKNIINVIAKNQNSK